MEIQVEEISKTTYLYQVSRKVKRKSMRQGPRRTWVARGGEQGHRTVGQANTPWRIVKRSK